VLRVLFVDDLYHGQRSLLDGLRGTNPHLTQVVMQTQRPTMAA